LEVSILESLANLFGALFWLLEQRHWQIADELEELEAVQR